MHKLLPVLASLLLLGAEAAAQEAPPPADPPALPPSLDATALANEAISAGVIASSMQTLTATNSGNTVTADTIETGDITLSADALSGFSGVGNFVMNTGNNNNLQGSISIVIVMPPP